MAYGNWGAFVYRDGERQREWEDNTPFRETELTAGYWQAFGSALGSEDDGPKPSPCHAVLGSKNVRLCGYKCYPRLMVDGKEVDLDPFMTEWSTWTSPQDGHEERDGEVWAGEIEGHTFRAVFDTERQNMIDLELTEPDGAKWTARCGYMYGAGHMDDTEAAA